MQNVENLREEIIVFFRDYFFLLSEAKYGRSLNYLLLKKCFKDYQ